MHMHQKFDIRIVAPICNFLGNESLALMLSCVFYTIFNFAEPLKKASWRTASNDVIIAAVIRGVFGASSRLRVMLFNYFLLLLARAFILAGVWALWCLGASLIFANFLTLILKSFFFFLFLVWALSPHLTPPPPTPPLAKMPRGYLSVKAVSYKLKRIIYNIYKSMTVYVLSINQLNGLSMV